MRLHWLKQWWSLLLLACCTLGQRPAPNKRHDVYIAGFFPFGGRVSGSIPEGQVGRGVMPAVKLAVDHINENPTLLRNYRLHVWWNDTQVSRLPKPFVFTIRCIVSHQQYKSTYAKLLFHIVSAITNKYQIVVDWPENSRIYFWNLKIFEKLETKSD